MSLSRELLKWLQSLDLSFPVKNPKRDLSNGFLVAEIFSCYFPSDINMFSYDNGTSVQRKISNWELLAKFFRANEVPISTDLINDTIHLKHNAAVSMLEEIYTFLTKKKCIRSRTPAAPTTPAPTFAKPTASKLIKDSMAESEMATTKDINKVVPMRAQAIIEEHTKTMKNERPPKDGMKSLLGKPPSRVKKDPAKGPRPMTPADSTFIGQVQFKEVQIKPYTVDPLSLRTRAKASPGTPSTASASAATAGHERLELSARGMAPLLANSRVATTIAGSVEVTLATEEFKHVARCLDPTKSPMAGFLEALPWLPANVRAGVFRDFAKMGQFLEPYLQDGNELYAFVVIMLTCLQLTNYAHEELVTTLETVGAAVVSKNGESAWTLFDSTALELLLSVMRENLPQRRKLARLIFQFCPEGTAARARALERAKQLLAGDSLTFAVCVSELVLVQKTFERGSPFIDEALAAVQTEQSPAVVAQFLSVLARVASRVEFDLCSSFITPVVTAASRFPGWWEVGAAAAQVLCRVLAGAGSQAEPQLVHDIQAVLREADSDLVNAAAVHWLTPLVGDRVANVLPLYTECVLGLRRAILTGWLATRPKPLLANAPSTAAFVSDYADLAPALLSQWGPFAAKLAQDAAFQGNSKDTLVLVLWGCLQAACAGADSAAALPPPDLPAWSEAFAHAKDALFTGLCREEDCAAAAQLLLVFYRNLQAEALQTLPLLLAAMRMIFNPASECTWAQAPVVHLLEQLLSCGGECAHAVAALVRNLTDDLRQAPKLRDLVSRVNN
eukprot:TRINITY_DN5868_c0_g1_i1.p1 TRINITY_DN5868_c0_g1~~TRINITY_DN5868_c0_g1_i1.p1  ORF type:complete len:787 (-),score=191.93 TRINITY_DN5868_c0_g1_i1:30-2390(-)